MKTIYLLIWHDWLGEANFVVCAYLDKKQATQAQEDEDKACLAEFKENYGELNNPEDDEIKPDYYTIREINLYD